MQPVLVLELLILLAVANGTPVVAKRLFGGAFARPLDSGALFADGRPWFGPSKTIRGVVLATLATTAAAAALGLGWKAGALLGVKRRLGLAPSSQAVGLDQIPESLVPLLATRLLLPLTVLDVAVATTLFFVGELVLSRLLYKWHVRDRPY